MSGSSAAALDPLVNSTTIEPTAGSASAIAMTPSPADVAKLQAQQAFLAYLLNRFHTLQLFLLAGYGIMFLLCLMLITYLRLNRHSAFRGDASAARKIILPAFEPLLWVLATATGVYVIFFCVALATELYTYEISRLATEVFYSGRQFVFLSVVVFMLQKSVSGPALRRSILITFILSTYTLPVAWYMMTYRPKTEFYGVITAVRAPMLLLYTYILIRPPGRASKRSLREFCLFAYVYYALLFTYNDLFNQTKLDSGFVLTYANLLCGALCPLVIWRVLKADTQHWRGLGQRAVALQRLFRQHNHLPERVSSRGLHVLIEMHRKYIIDFAYLEIKQRIGVGASAVVFNGLLRSETPVAIKMYTPSEFTEETVAGFSQEAALCGALHHPNVVRFYGMCVCPPTICLVSELCQGSLEDVLCATARHTHSGNRQQLLLNVAYMLDATRAVAYLHSFRPAFLHRDIKPGNFLVDVENTVKLTDFGESRSLPRSQVVGGGVKGTKPLGRMTSVAELKGDDGERISMDVPMMGAVNLQPVRSSLTGNLVDNAPKMTVKGTVDYMAPEVINGRAGLATYGEAADVYSLGITMWDILNPGQDKYPAANGNHLKIFDLVSNGQRPLLDDRLHPTLRGVIESAWHGDPRLRPSAQNVVNILETVQEELLAAFASELMDELDDVEGIGQKGIEHSLTGEQAVAHMVRLEYVGSVGEALRLGNALMDAGLLHHVKHARPFEPTSTVYFMDDDNVTLCQPFSVKPLDMSDNLSATLETTPENESTESHVSQPRSHRTESTYANHLERVAATSSGSHSTPLMLENGICMCRKLGQRLAVPKVAARRRFRGKKRQAAANANSVQQQLQARLLQDNYDPLATARGSSEFEEFDLLAASAEGDSVV